jgi:hypothetical protein
MSRRVAHLVLVAVLGLVVWGTAAAGTVGATETAFLDSGASSGAEQIAAHLAAGVGVVGRNAAALTGGVRDHAGGAVRVVRGIALAALLLGLAMGRRPRPIARRGHHTLPVWSGWFADPGRLRGPPAG